MIHLTNRGSAAFLFLSGGGKSYLVYILGPFSPKQGGEQGEETALGWGFPPVSQPQTPI